MGVSVGWGVRSRVRLACAAVIVAFVGAAFASPARGQNLLSNGDFERGLTKDGEPVGWHSRLTSVIPVPEYTDPANKKGRTGAVRFKCGCGADWGAVRPWTSLWCTRCGHMNTGLEDSGDWYLKNHESVALIDGAKGRAIGLRMDRAVGEMQGVRILSDLMKAERGAAYEFALDAISRGVELRAWVEGFKLMGDDKEAAAWAATLSKEANPLGQRYRLKRVFRQQIHAGNPGSWTRSSERFANTGRGEFDFMLVSLYAYGAPGEAGYDHVVLRKLNAQETRAYFRETPPRRDMRLR